MPIPKPRTAEKKREFIARCNKALINEEPKSDIRNGICYSQWENRHKEKK